MSSFHKKKSRKKRTKKPASTASGYRKKSNKIHTNKSPAINVRYTAPPTPPSSSASPIMQPQVFNKSFITQTPSHSDNNTKQNKTFCNAMPVLQPFGPFRTVEQIIVILVLVYTSIEVPYTLTFDVLLRLDSAWGIIALLIDIFLLFDIVLNFRTGYVDKYDHLHIITEPSKIAKKYITGWFFIDLISSLPFEILLPLFIDKSASVSELLKILRIFRLLRGLKMLRLFRVLKLIQRFNAHVFVRETAMILKVVRCLCAMLITSHYFACFWYLVGEHTYNDGKPSWIDLIIEQHGNTASNFTKYSYAWYWAIYTLFTTGYGDIHANNTEEQWTASASILVGTCFFAYFIGVLTTLLEEGDRIRMHELERIEEAQLFCSHYRLPTAITRAIVTHLRYHCNYNYVFDHDKIMQAIPTHLKNRITSHVSSSIKDLDIFRHLQSHIIGEIALKMTSVSCNSGHRLFKKGQFSHEFYIQRTGKSKLLLSKDSAILERGHVIGEYCMLSGKHRDTLKCVTWCEFYVLNINDLLQVLTDNFIEPKEVEKQYRIIKQCLRSTLHKSKTRKVAFKSDEIDDLDPQFTHEFSPNATKNIIHPPPSPFIPNNKNHKKPTHSNSSLSAIKRVFENKQYKLQSQMSKSHLIDKSASPKSQKSPKSLKRPKSPKSPKCPKYPQNDKDKDIRSSLRSSDLILESGASLTRKASAKLMEKFSKLLFKERSYSRHNAVVKHTTHKASDRELEYSDHENSHYYSSETSSFKLNRNIDYIFNNYNDIDDDDDDPDDDYIENKDKDNDNNNNVYIEMNDMKSNENEMNKNLIIIDDESDDSFACPTTNKKIVSTPSVANASGSINRNDVPD